MLPGLSKLMNDDDDDDKVKRSCHHYLLGVGSPDIAASVQTSDYRTLLVTAGRAAVWTGFQSP